MIIIRPAELSDAEPLSAMICETAEHLLRPHYNEAQWNVFVRYYSPVVLLEKIKSQRVFCAENAGLIVGTIALDGDMVVGFYTRVSCLNQGIGKRLMEHLEAWCLASGISQLQLAASPEGLAFYYKNGWQKVKEFTPVHYGVGFQETLMIKKLNKQSDHARPIQ